MRERRKLLYLVVFGAALLVATQLSATTMLRMDLGDLTQRADRIFRGTVVDISPGTIAVGGGELPTTTYRLRVEESFKGGADQVKDDEAIIEIRMIGSIKDAGPDENGYVKFSPFYDVPRLEMGSDYLLFTTSPSSVGLSTTVGLGQGAFTVFSMNKEDFAVNLYSNLGLGVGDGGPVAYSELTAAVLALLGE